MFDSSRPTPIELYSELVHSGELLKDPVQEGVINLLNDLYVELNPALGFTNLRSLADIFKLASLSKHPKVRGLYFWGGVGRGKTMLMDLFFRSLPRKFGRRYHFHRFMQRVHQEFTLLSGTRNPTGQVAAKLANGCRVICFDEFYVEDIGDAMLLGRLINELFEKKVTLVTTSNTHPDNLYKDGLHRGRFLPAIESIKENCEIYELDSEQDYRLRTLEQLEIFVIGKNEEGIRELESNFSELTNNDYLEGKNIQVLGRKIKTIKLSQGSVWISFREICEGPRSANDYIEICSEFHTLFVSDVPVLQSSNDDSARRFIALVDECYERNVNLILSMETGLNEMYVGERLSEPFKRTISRLEEMRSREYLSRPHII